MIGAMTYTRDPRVDAYIDALPGWQRTICREVRDLVHSVDPEVTETIKRSRQPYFVLQGNICALLAARDHVNVFLYDGGIVPDPQGIITAGHDNQTARTVGVPGGRDDQEEAAGGDVQADRRQQPRRWLAEVEARELSPSGARARCPSNICSLSSTSRPRSEPSFPMRRFGATTVRSCGCTRRPGGGCWPTPWPGCSGATATPRCTAVPSRTAARPAAGPRASPPSTSGSPPGGLPRGRVTLLQAARAGPSGRLTLLQALAARASREGEVVYVDVAASLDPGFLADLGADLGSCLAVLPGRGRWREGLAMARALVVAGSPWVGVALDRGHPRNAEIEQALNGLVEAVHRRRAVCVVAAPAPAAAPLAYASSLTLSCLPVGWQEAHGDVIGLRVALEVSKSRLFAPGRHRHPAAPLSPALRHCRGGGLPRGDGARRATARRRRADRGAPQCVTRRIVCSALAIPTSGWWRRCAAIPSCAGRR